MSRLIILALVALLSACASYSPVPEGYAGPTAIIHDVNEAEDRTRARMFVVAEIDGRLVNNAIIESRRRSEGHGFYLTTTSSSRLVPIRPMKLKLVATHQTGAPIHEIASRMAGTFHSVEGTVDFTPKPNGRYMVTGELAKEGSSVWLRDVDTGEPATEKVVSVGKR